MPPTIPHLRRPRRRRRGPRGARGPRRRVQRAPWRGHRGHVWLVVGAQAREPVAKALGWVPFEGVVGP